MISVNARSDTDNDVAAHEAVPGLLAVVNSVIGTPIDASTALANASLQDLVATLKSAGAVPPQAPGHPKFAGLRVYGIAIDFDRRSHAAFPSLLGTYGRRLNTPTLNQSVPPIVIATRVPWFRRISPSQRQPTSACGAGSANPPWVLSGLRLLHTARRDMVAWSASQLPFVPPSTPLQSGHG